MGLANEKLGIKNILRPECGTLQTASSPPPLNNVLYQERKQCFLNGGK